MHGDLYSHNILIDENGHSLLGDFGAATLYDNIDDIECASFERLEVRAFGCLLEDMLDRCKPEDLDSHKDIVEALRDLKHKCMDVKVSNRPFFRDISNMLLKI
jgi:tRNA A-37 threonylcarbamoyl transferase component Bud32